jgi:glutamate 5-kinase
VIASSVVPNVLIDLVEGKPHGTLFQTEITPQESRKRWLLSEKKQGTIHVDQGAALQISKHGASLLPAGIIKVSDGFDRGAIVHIIGPNEKCIAVGIANYDDQEIKKLIGAHSKNIEDLLGYSCGSEIIHRTNMTRMKSKQEEESGC